MKRSIRKKLILLVVMFGATIVTLTSTTFAWFATNRNAWLEKFELNIESPKSLLISSDGENFGTTVTASQLRKAIGKRLLGDAEDVTEAKINEEFEKIALRSVTSIDLKDFRTVSNKDIITEYDDNHKITGQYYDLIPATKYDFLQFDLWFRIDTASADKDYDLQFVDDDYANNASEGEYTEGSKIEGRENDVYLYNGLYTTGLEDTRTGTRRDGTSYTKGEYIAGDTIKVDTTDALRLGVLHDDGVTSSIFEPSIGLGSYAIDGQTEANYNPSKNAMFTYFNNIHEARLKPIKGSEELVNKYKNTYKSLGEAVSFGVFARENGQYNDIKLTVSLWLEGMDADYISGVYDRSVSMFLNFCIKEKGDTGNE